jgi:hypothetical protein
VDAPRRPSSWPKTHGAADLPDLSAKTAIEYGESDSFLCLFVDLLLRVAWILM